MKRQSVCVGVTCVGGRFVYDAVQALRCAPDMDVTIIGFDANPHSTGQWFVDAFVPVPYARDDAHAYVEALVQACEEKVIQVMIVGSEDETRAVAAYQDAFTARGIATTAPSPLSDSASIVDKLLLFETLEQRGVDVGAYRAVTTNDTVSDCVEAIGYPVGSVVLKPRRAAGSRGVFIVDARVASYQSLLPDRLCGTGTLEAVLTTMNQHAVSHDEYLAMPYYGGEVYDVDCLAVRGRAVNIVPRRRQYTNPLSPVNEGCCIDMNPIVLAYVERLIEALAIHGACDFDIAMDDYGCPKVLDASSRMSGSVAASCAAGVNIPAQLVRILLGLPLMDYDVENGLELRPVSHFVAI